jgi:hypothetical protein
MAVVPWDAGASYYASTGDGTGSDPGTDRTQSEFTISDFRDNEWHHVVYQFDDNECDFVFVDGTKYTRSGLAGTGGSVSLTAGRWQANATGLQNQTPVACGDIADIRLYSRILTDAEVALIAQGFE